MWRRLALNKGVPVGLLSAALILSALAAPAPGQDLGLEASVVDFVPAEISENDYPVQSAAGKPLGTARWRVVAGTGNCCENFIGTSRDGRIFDFGGSFIHYSEDLGESWKRVVPIEPALNGEGAIVDAPGGDIVGATWFAYEGDRIISFKYDAASKTWLHTEQLLHTPFFDRPWIATVKGPFTVGAITVPYITILTSNFTRDVQYISLDGLHYFLPSNKAQDQETDQPVTKWLDLPADQDADWTQPVTELGLGPLAGGGAIAQGGGWLPVPWMVMEPPETRWSGFSFPDGTLPDGRVLTDSKGRIHHLATFPGESEFRYMMSSSGGRGWGGADVALPEDLVVEDYDFKANAALGKAVVGIHAHDNAKNVDRDLVYELSLGGDVRVEKLYFVGKGDIDVSSAITGGDLRFDFSTIGILPGGQIVTTFVDSDHRDPTLAILLDGGPGASGDVAAPQVTRLTVKPNPFTPNGDGRGDEVKVSFSVDEPASVTISVKKGRAVMKRLALGNDIVTERAAYRWDGLKRNGRPAPSGRYTVELVVRDSAGNERVLTRSLTLRR